MTRYFLIVTLTVLAMAAGIGAQTPSPENVQAPEIAPNYKSDDRSLPDLGRVGVDVTQQKTLTLNDAITLALENNRDIVRVTNSGISALITAQGKIVDPLPMFAATSHVWTAETSHVATPYTKYGDWFAISCVIISALAIIASFIYHSRAK